ncbi:MAG: bacillithiol biosynthesis deacetylase BshB1 [Calditrichaeota bacterium]|nr:bacillithiol biosynthesis deacetylase BshB1 [Calditrichota bacterium]
MLDVLAIAAHPDDVEISAAGTLLTLKSQGYKVGIIDLTEGELSSNGTVEIRRKETLAANKILGLDFRKNLGLADGFFADNDENRMLLINEIREHQPKIIIAPELTERHPDHERCARLVKEANFQAGLKMIETKLPHHRATKVYYATYNYDVNPTVIFDISQFWEKKLEAIKSYSSQFNSTSGNQEKTYISRPEFIEFLEAKARYFGEKAGVRYGEAYFTFERPLYTTFPELTK